MVLCVFLRQGGRGRPGVGSITRIAAKAKNGRPHYIAPHHTTGMHGPGEEKRPVGGREGGNCYVARCPPSMIGIPMYGKEQVLRRQRRGEETSEATASHTPANHSSRTTLRPSETAPITHHITAVFVSHRGAQCLYQGGLIGQYGKWYCIVLLQADVLGSFSFFFFFLGRVCPARQARPARGWLTGWLAFAPAGISGFENWKARRRWRMDGGMYRFLFWYRPVEGAA